MKGSELLQMWLREAAKDAVKHVALACLVCIACENGTCKRGHLLNQHCDGSGVLPARGRG